MLNLKKIRLEKEMSVAELARVSGVSRPYLLQLESKMYNNPSLEVVIKLCNALAVTPNDLIKEELYKRG